MVKKFLIFTLVTFLASQTATAETDKSKYCPDIQQIRIVRLQKPYTHIYYAFNSDDKYFVSGEYVEDNHNGPARPLGVYDSIYEPAGKKLLCVYYAYAREQNSHPTLINVGDY